MEPPQYWADATYEQLDNDYSKRIFQKLHLLPKDIPYPAYRFDSGEFVQAEDKEIFIYQGSIYRRTINYGNATWDDSISYDQMAKLLACSFSLSKPPTRYATVKTGVAFKQLYPTQNVVCGYVDSVGPEQEEGRPCVICGIVLPLRFMEIDHQRPRSGGSNEATMKLMRVLGLTIVRPHGAKCMQLYDVIQQALLVNERDIWASLKLYLWKEVEGIANNNVPPIQIVPFVSVEQKTSRTPYLATDSTRQARYTLNVKGEIFYSILRALEYTDLLATAALHSLPNLRPVCGPCNKARGGPTNLKFPPGSI